MGRLCAVLVGFVIVAGACASADAPFDDSGFEDVGDNSDVVIGDIEWRLRAIPDAVDLGAAKFDAVEFGQCESVEPDSPDTDIEISCTNPWAEVAWYVVPAEQLSVGQTLTVSFGDLKENNRVRASIHEVSETGETRKLATHPMLLSGDSIEATIDAQLDHYIYVARGRSLALLWGDGSIAYSLSVSAE